MDRAAVRILTDTVQQAEVAILRYLLANLEARDTIEGIEKWWLPQSREYGLGDVAAALKILEERSLIRAWKPAFGKPVYGRGDVDAQRLKDYLGSLEQTGTTTFPPKPR